MCNFFELQWFLPFLLVFKFAFFQPSYIDLHIEWTLLHLYKISHYLRKSTNVTVTGSVKISISTEANVSVLTEYDWFLQSVIIFSPTNQIISKKMWQWNVHIWANQWSSLVRTWTWISFGFSAFKSFFDDKNLENIGNLAAFQKVIVTLMLNPIISTMNPSPALPRQWIYAWPYIYILGANVMEPKSWWKGDILFLVGSGCFS